jgi:hypothetical protein
MCPSIEWAAYFRGCSWSLRLEMLGDGGAEIGLDVGLGSEFKVARRS